MNSFEINSKRLDFGSLLFSPSERYSLGMNTSFSNDAIFIREEVKVKDWSISKRTKNLIHSYFAPNRINILFIDFYTMQEKINKAFLYKVYESSESLGSDMLIVGLKKNEDEKELILRLEFAKEMKDKYKKFIILLVDPRLDIPVDVLKQYIGCFDIIGLYLNVPFGGKPLITRIIKSNLAIWEHLEKPVFLMGAPRKISEAISKGIKFYQPFFSLLSNLYCTHFRSGPSKAKFVIPSTNTIFTQEKLIALYGENTPLSTICNCDACEEHTCKSFFVGKDTDISRRIRIHETHLTDMQIKELKSLDIAERTTYLNKKIDAELSPQIATISQLNNINIKEAINEKLLEKIIEIYSADEEAAI